MTKPHVGRVGLWTAFLDSLPAAAARETAAEIEALGYAAIWLPEVMMREALTASMLLLDGTERITIATGIANIWGRDPVSMSMAHKTISEAHPGRFVLGIGVSHQPIVEGLRRHDYRRPLEHMRGYLDAMDAAPYVAPAPVVPPVRVLAALRPRMLALAAEKADGAHPYLATPEHTARAREIVGPDAWLAPEQKVMVTTDAGAARVSARNYLQAYLGLPNYRNNLLTLGFDDDDFADGGSDRLVDSLVRHGDPDTAIASVKEHLEAGADHVAVQVLTVDGSSPMADWRELAPALTAL